MCLVKPDGFKGAGVSADMKSLKPLLKCLTISNCIVKIVKRVVMR